MADAARAVRRARVERRAVVLMLPIDVQAAGGGRSRRRRAGPDLTATRPSERSVAAAAALTARGRAPGDHRRPRRRRSPTPAPALRRLGELTGAVLATSAVANGLFAGDAVRASASRADSRRRGGASCSRVGPRARVRRRAQPLDVRGTGAARSDADVVQVDATSAAIGAHRPVALGIVGDARETAAALIAALDGHAVAGLPHAASSRPRSRRAPGATSPTRRPRHARSTRARCRIALDDLLPAERIVVVDSGHFMGWPSMYLRRPGRRRLGVPQRFQAVGLGLGNAIGAAIARPDRVTVAARGRRRRASSPCRSSRRAARLQLPLLVVVYDDAAYGAEVHHFGPMGHAVDLALPRRGLRRARARRRLRRRSVRELDDLVPVAGWPARRRPAGRRREGRSRHLRRMARGGVHADHPGGPCPPIPPRCSQPSRRSAASSTSRSRSASARRCCSCRSRSPTRRSSAGAS